MPKHEISKKKKATFEFEPFKFYNNKLNSRLKSESDKKSGSNVCKNLSSNLILLATKKILSKVFIILVDLYSSFQMLSLIQVLKF